MNARRERKERGEQSLFSKSIETVLRFRKTIVFSLLAVVAIIVVVANRESQKPYGVLVILAAEGLLLIENAVKMWALKRWSQKIVCYVLDSLLLLVITYFTDGTLISTQYVIILSEFYLTQENFTSSIVMGVSSLVLFLVMSGVARGLKNESVDVWWILSNSFNDLIIFVLHFSVLNLMLLIYRKNNEIEKTLDELNETNRKLREAYNELQAVTVLEERQRIAKDIHDTAGHSITTVIMQTEAAKLVIDKDVEDAKRKITSANLQAKHALEELRESVHLLSGAEGKQSLRDMLLRIVHESSDGTGVTVRHFIDDVNLGDEKARFICNTLKEGISNGMRHGGATAFWFELKEGDGLVSFQLSDNGKGMRLSDLKEGFGLEGMRRRAANLGGTVWFETEPDEGFEIHMTLPLDARPQPKSDANDKEG